MSSPHVAALRQYSEGKNIVEPPRGELRRPAAWAAAFCRFAWRIYQTRRGRFDGRCESHEGLIGNAQRFPDTFAQSDDHLENPCLIHMYSTFVAALRAPCDPTHEEVT
jgi:hypothetical protein